MTTTGGGRAGADVIVAATTNAGAAEFSGAPDRLPNHAEDKFEV